MNTTVYNNICLKHKYYVLLSKTISAYNMNTTV